MTEDTDLCGLCNQSYFWHINNEIIHRFQLKGDKLEVKKKVQARVAQFPFDPVLRTALIDAGILTPEQLTQAEDKIRATIPGVGGSDSTNGDRVRSE